MRNLRSCGIQFENPFERLCRGVMLSEIAQGQAEIMMIGVIGRIALNRGPDEGNRCRRLTALPRDHSHEVQGVRVSRVV